MTEALDRRLFERRLFALAAVGFPLIVLAGFARTYYARGWFGGPPVPSSLVHAHGLLMTAWVLLFVTQVWLVASRRIRVHQRLGYASIGLAVLIVVVGFVTAVTAGKYGSASTPPGIAPAAFMIVPMFDLLMFAGFFGAAIFYRRQPAPHKRMMLLTAINFLPPAIARLPLPALQALGPLWFFGVPSGIGVLCLVLDTKRHGRVNRPFLVGLLLLMASYVIRLALMNTSGWLRVSGWMTSLV